MKIQALIISAFLLLAPTARTQRIAVLSDTHVSPGNASEAQLLRAVDEINAADYDLVVMNGDLSNEGSDVELTNMKSILDRITHPLVVLPGNHENNWSQSATKTFVDLWGTDRFAVVVDSLVMVGINCGPYMKMGDGHVKQEDLHWLRSTLDSLVTPGRRVLSFNHYPLLDDLDNCADYLSILEDYPVVAHINGHYHTWRPYMAGGETAGSDLPCVMVRALDMRGGDYGYTDVEVSDDWIHINNKPVGQPRRPMYAFAAHTDHSKAKWAARPEVIAPAGFEVTKVWADSASIFTRLGFDADRVYFGNSLGYAKAVSKTDGTQQWATPTGASLFSRPVALTSGRLAVPTHDGILMLDPRTGALKKKYTSVEGPYVADGSLTPDGKGYLQGGYKRFEYRDAKTGALRWVYDSIANYCQGAPAIDGDDIVFGAWDTNLRCIDRRTGRLKWSWNSGKKANMLGPGNVVPVITDDKVFVVAPDRYMTALDRKTGAVLWRDNSHRFRESLGHSEDRSTIYAKTMDGELVAVDATAPTYKEKWQADLGIGYDHAPCIVLEKDGVVYAGSRRGVLTLTAADGSGVIASLPLGVSELNGIDLDPYTGEVYVSLIEGTVFRITDNRKK